MNGCSTRTSRAGRAAAEPCHADPCRVDPTRELFTHNRGGAPCHYAFPPSTELRAAVRLGACRCQWASASPRQDRWCEVDQCFVWSILMRCRTRRRAGRLSVRLVGWAVCRLASASWQRLPAPRSIRLLLTRPESGTMRRGSRPNEAKHACEHRSIELTSARWARRPAGGRECRS